MIFIQRSNYTIKLKRIIQRAGLQQIKILLATRINLNANIFPWIRV